MLTIKPPHPFRVGYPFSELTNNTWQFIVLYPVSAVGRFDDGVSVGVMVEHGVGFEAFYQITFGSAEK